MFHGLTALYCAMLYILLFFIRISCAGHCAIKLNSCPRFQNTVQSLIIDSLPAF